jgi:nucleotide-binding universal stress UspA family protein
MFETIVWATDGSELADRALPHVLELARVHQSRIVAVYASELLKGRFGSEPLLVDEPDVRTRVEKQVADIHAQGVPIELRLTTGTHDVPELIAAAAREVEADLIVVGTHGLGGFKAAVLGSVARGLLHDASCPVLAIPPAREVVAAERKRELATTA